MQVIIRKLLHFASMLLHFALVLHFAAILITFALILHFAAIITFRGVTDVHSG